MIIDGLSIAAISLFASYSVVKTVNSACDASRGSRHRLPPGDPVDTAGKMMLPGAIMMDLLPRKITEFMMNQRGPQISAKLREAGEHEPDAKSQLGWQLMLAAFGFIVGVGISGFSASALLIVPVGTWFCWKVPVFQINQRIESRRKTVVGAMPDFIDLVAIAIEAGLNLDQAIAAYCARFDNPVADEFARVVEEMRLGRPRMAAFNDLAATLDLDVVVNFVTAIQNSYELGGPLSASLKEQAVSARRCRRTLIQEKTAAAPIKMLFPIAGLILPSLMIVILGPAFIQIAGG